MIKHLSEYKLEKLTEEEIKELTSVIAKLNDCIDILKPFHKKINIMESISILHNSRTLYEIELSQIKR